MSKHLSEWIPALEAEWAKPDGFLARVREGVFDPQQGAGFVRLLESLTAPTDAVIDRRLVALLWYIPGFLQWQKERVSEKGGDAIALERLSNQVQGIIEGILGVP
jgi:hypothetical protein